MYNIWYCHRLSIVYPDLTESLECNGRVIAEFIALRPKMYSILEASGASMKKVNTEDYSEKRHPTRTLQTGATRTRRNEVETRVPSVHSKSRSHDRSIWAKQDLSQSNGHQKVDRCRWHCDIRIRAYWNRTAEGFVEDWMRMWWHL